MRNALLNTPLYAEYKEMPFLITPKVPPEVNWHKEIPAVVYWGRLNHALIMSRKKGYEVCVVTPIPPSLLT